MEILKNLLEVGRNLLETSKNAHGRREELIMEFLGISIREILWNLKGIPKSLYGFPTNLKGIRRN